MAISVSVLVDCSHCFSPAVTMIISVAGTVGSARSRSFAPPVAARPRWAVPGTAVNVAETSVNHQESRYTHFDDFL